MNLVRGSAPCAWIALTAILTASALAAETSRWHVDARGAPWKIAVGREPDFRAGSVREAVVVSLPGATAVQPIAYARARYVLPKRRAGNVTLSFRVSDDFVGATAGYIFAEAHVDGRAVWSADVAGGEGGLRPVRAAFDAGRPRGRHLTIDLGVWLRKAVSNFPVRVVFTDVVLIDKDGSRVELTRPVQPVPLEPLPRDLPLPAAEPTRGWPALARIVQPWGHSQAIAVKQHATWARRLSETFGFNTIIMLPPAAHNAITADRAEKNASMRIGDRAFADALDDYRTHGFRIILYGSIMHCGHDPAWQTGRLGKEHPEWNQVDADGDPIVTYGQPWLCPSTAALGYTIDYTRKLVERWRPDAVMLDNNEFYTTAQGKPTCYCEHCQKGFRVYVAARFGSERARRLLGVDDPKALRIPTEDGELYHVWIHWRNRVWAEATGKFRAGIRRVKPSVVLLANTQYLFSSWVLATDLQYAQEDAVLSESRGQSPTAMSAKMLLGQAVARGRPLWNYLGTFDEKDYRRLRPPATIQSISAASLAHGGRPWIVFYGFERPSPSLEALARQMRLAKRWIEASVDARRWANVISLFSFRGRNHLGRPFMPSHLGALRTAQIPVEPLRVIDLTTFGLGGYPAVIADGVACLSDDEVRALTDWVKQGGTLLATPDVGWYDPIGRLRPRSLLSDRLGVVPPATKTAGRGRVVWCESGGELVEALNAHVPPIFQLNPLSPDWELVAYRQAKPGRLWVHAINHGKTTDRAPRLTIQRSPNVKVNGAAWWTDTGDRAASVVEDAKTLRVALPSGTGYAILSVGIED